LSFEFSILKYADKLIWLQAPEFKIKPSGLAIRLFLIIQFSINFHALTRTTKHETSTISKYPYVHFTKIHENLYTLETCISTEGDLYPRFLGQECCSQIWLTVSNE